MIILDGKKLASEIHTKLQSQIQQHFQSTPPPKLCVILIGSNPASISYVNIKKKTALKIGFNFELTHLPENTSQNEVLNAINTYNNDPEHPGLLLQLPIPKHLNALDIIEHIDPDKDVDGLHPLNAGKLLLGQNPNFLPCTPRGILHLLKHYNIPIESKNATIIGRSNILGKPIAQLLMQNNATTTICHTRTKNLETHINNADILIAAAGSPNLIKGHWIKPEATIIDAGFNKINDKIYGDVDFNEAAKRAAYITPVPGGVGPMTVAMLLTQCLEAALSEKINKKS